MRRRTVPAPLPAGGRRAAAAALAVLAAVAGPAGAAAQAAPPEPDRVPRWTEDAAVIGLNALLGGVVAGAGAWARGGDAQEAFVEGLLGGTVGWAGKRTAIQGFDGAGLLGRAVGGVGASMVASASADRPLLSEVWLPLGPLWVRARGSGGLPLRVSLPDLGTVLWAATRDELELDVSASLSNGTTVFRAPRHRLEHDEPVGGIAIGSVVLVGASTLDAEDVREHEMVHVLQNDLLRHAVAHPVEAWAARRLVGRELPFTVGAVDLLHLAAYELLLHHAVEAEAYWWDAR